MDVWNEIKRTLEEEGEAILNLSRNFGPAYLDAVELIYKCSGKVIVTGLGKSGIVGRKIAATLASTGTPAFFVHATEALHGDAGMMKSNDVVIAISNSGESEELIKLIPIIKRLGIKMIAITNNTQSSLAKHSDIILDLKIQKEADKFGLAPTTSSTVTLALGDALAMAVVSKRDFKPEDFAVLHPGGSLGRKLLLKVEDVMRKGDENPVIYKGSSIEEAIIKMTSKRTGGVSIVNERGCLVGIITDGDLRRFLQRYGSDIFNQKLSEIMTKNPINIKLGKLANEALHLMEDRPGKIFVLPVVDSEERPVGLIHIHDLVIAGIN